MRRVDKTGSLEYIFGMKVKTSITLSSDLIKEIGRHGKAYKSRSDFVEAAIMAFIGQAIRDK